MAMKSTLRCLQDCLFYLNIGYSGLGTGSFISLNLYWRVEMTQNPLVCCFFMKQNVYAYSITFFSYDLKLG